ncbi:IS4 family transposase [Spartinivicinus marinus]|uniref:IS4 family transposase n=1 Tax=Spartinivicinus marinus TaxID=2994442 RepID=UPI00225313BA|nr:IS4 family transposase [Spartinivicinus marinus]
MYSDAFCQRHRQDECNFIRSRKLTFPHLVLFLLNFLKGSADDELDGFFNLLQEEETDQPFVTKSAFTQARKKLKYSAFVELNQVFVDTLYDKIKPSLWKGFRVCAVDGSTINLPNNKALREHFQPKGKDNQHPQARASQLYDVLNHVTIDALLKPHNIGERALALQHLQHTHQNDLVLYDRGYPSFELFAQHRELNRHFCARSPWNLYNETRDFLNSGKKQQQVTLTPCSQTKQLCKKQGISVQPIKVRLIRVDLDSGEPEVLITSVLSENTITAVEFKALYHMRWGIEEDYKRVKCRLEVEQFSGLSVHAVLQDFHAKIFSKNLTALLVNEAQKQVGQNKSHCKHPYKVNFTRALSKMKDNIIKLLVFSYDYQRFHRVIKWMASFAEAVRPNRSFERNKKVRPPCSMNNKRTR